MNTHAERTNLFHSLQFGFHKGLGTCDALLTITNVIQKALDSGCEVRMAGLCFSAVFDRVNHEALISKLRRLGLGGAFLSILIEFLTDRVQRIVVDGHYSVWRKVVPGFLAEVGLVPFSFHFVYP